MDSPVATVFCDFDGTVTSEDTFDLVAAAVAPERWQQIKRQLFAFEINLRQGMALLAEVLTPADLEAMVARMQGIEPRPEFLPFLDALEAAGIPFVLVSGGLVPLVEAVLGLHRQRLHQLIAADVRPHPAGRLEFHSPFSSDEELVAKARVIEHFGAGRSVVIGDSITDLRMAEVADLVFARAPLSDWLDERGITYHRWEDFGDVAAVLRREGLLGAVAA